MGLPIATGQKPTLHLSTLGSFFALCRRRGGQVADLVAGLARLVEDDRALAQMYQLRLVRAGHRVMLVRIPAKASTESG